MVAGVADSRLCCCETPGSQFLLIEIFTNRAFCLISTPLFLFFRRKISSKILFVLVWASVPYSAESEGIFPSKYPFRFQFAHLYSSLMLMDHFLFSLRAKMAEQPPSSFFAASAFQTGSTSFGSAFQGSAGRAFHLPPQNAFSTRFGEEQPAPHHFGMEPIFEPDDMMNDTAEPGFSPSSFDENDLEERARALDEIDSRPPGSQDMDVDADCPRASRKRKFTEESGLLLSLQISINSDFNFSFLVALCPDL